MTVRPGNTILEVMVSIGVLAVATVSIGSLISSIQQSNRAVTERSQAAALAQQGLELGVALAQPSFRCTGTCSCVPTSGYSSCWTTCPTGIPSCTATTLYHPVKILGTWSLATGSETVNLATSYTRELTITAVGGNDQVKNITATVHWVNHGQNRSTSVSTIVSAWQN